MAIFITFDKRNGYFYQKIGIKAGISPFCMSISISIEFQSFIVSVSVSVSKLWTCMVSVSYRYRLFRPGKYQYRIGIEKSGIADLWVRKNISMCPKNGKMYQNMIGHRPITTPLLDYHYYHIIFR